jgi:hypothetical protein
MGLCRGLGGLFVSSEDRVWVEMLGHGSFFSLFSGRLSIASAFLVRMWRFIFIAS